MQNAAMGFAQAGLMGLNGLGSVCQVGSRFAAFGSVAKGTAEIGTRGMLGLGAAMGGVSAYDKYQHGEYLGAALDLVEAGVAGAHMLRSCFPAGTKLVTEEGYRLVEEILQDDEVGSRDEHNPNGPLVFKRVEEVFTRAAMILELHVGGQLIKTTGEHPFYVENRGWLPAKELAVGDMLATLDGPYVPVTSVRATEEFTQVYNFRIADHHTYFVGDEDWGFAVWAHNASYSKTEEQRNTPGKASQSGPLESASGKWLDAKTPAAIPAQVAEALVGREFKSFKEMRGAIWETIAAHEELNGAFSGSNLSNMEGGFSPFAPTAYHINGSDAGMRFNLHHIQAIENGGAVYDLSNLQIVSPKVHLGLHS
jgi:hypothetical protein